jgi:hypothetical protein
MPFPMESEKSYRPLPDELIIKESGIDGIGLFATENIPRGRTLGRSHYNFHGAFGLGLIRSPLGGFINHSPEPNCRIVIRNEYMSIHIWYLKTTKKVKEGEELTLKYGTYKVLNPNV